VQEKPDFEARRQAWYNKYLELFRGAPPELPPMREINHRIPLIDEDKQYNYHLPRCPDTLKGELFEKIERYTTNGWWEECRVPQAAPLLSIPKKSGKLQTVVDCCKQNDNTVCDVTPFPDQDQIRMDVARAKYRSKIDLSDAYEQVRIEPKDVPKTFATPFGTMVSKVMQMGDCNAPATFQRLMTHTFQKEIGKSVFDHLQEQHLFLKKEKCELYAETIDCLGHCIDDQGIHVDTDKMSQIRDWRTPCNANKVLQFLGLVQYIAPHLPDVSAYTGPLSKMAMGNCPFVW
jgi:hypothetical protein